MMIEYREGDSLLHRLDVRTKALWGTVVIALAFLLAHPVAGVILVVLLLALIATAGVPWAGLKRIAGMLSPILVILLAVSAFSSTPDQFEAASSRHVILTLFPNGTAPLTVGGLFLGCMFVCRIMIMVLTSVVITSTTPLDDFLHLFRKLKIPPTLGFVLTTALRFVPTMEAKSSMILDAQRSRGAAIDSGGFFRTIRSSIAIMVPLIVDSIRMSENLAVALVNRGFGGSKEATVMSDIIMKPVDYWLAACAMVLLGVGIALKISGLVAL